MEDAVDIIISLIGLRRVICADGACMKMAAGVGAQ